MPEGSAMIDTEARPAASPVIGNVSDTARWVAVYRAMESERPDAIFRDPYARRLAGARGEEIVRTMRRGRSMAWPMIVRTAVFDELIMHVIERDAVDLVLNLAAGLDARPYRLPLPSTLRWVDVDLPGILAYKAEQMAAERPRCVLETAAVDLTDTDARRALFARLGSDARRVLVVSEGLLAYLTPEQVGALATDLHAQPSFTSWITEIASPYILRMMQRMWGKQLGAARAPMHFGPAEGGEFFRPYGWRVAESRSVMDEAVRLNRMMRGAWIWRVLGLFATPQQRARRQEEWRKASSILELARV
ncbi:MAG TPA: class I SAM-dependent methyltransferase [Gemmatimonadaceae bacterium]|nr:class I SAM-dependent methyltransferase [Gemmatimonadaceae bacterium]